MLRGLLQSISIGACHHAVESSGLLSGSSRICVQPPAHRHLDDKDSPGWIIDRPAADAQIGRENPGPAGRPDRRCAHTCGKRASASRHHREPAKRRVKATLDELAVVQDATGGDIEIRVAPFIPHMGINAIDVGSPAGLLVLQHYEHRPAGESAPVFSLRPADGFWYEHFPAEAERLWQDGTPWPLAPSAALRRSARPLFMQEFGPKLDTICGSEFRPRYLS